jgi:hypothetical protein
MQQFRGILTLSAFVVASTVVEAQVKKSQQWEEQLHRLTCMCTIMWPETSSRRRQPGDTLYVYDLNGQHPTVPYTMEYDSTDNEFRVPCHKNSMYRVVLFDTQKRVVHDSTFMSGVCCSLCRHAH